MNQLEVRIVRLEPMRVAGAHGFGSQPESIAWSKILAFAKSKGILDNLSAHRFFGFNNPDPSPGSPNYGYEQWVTVAAEEKPEDDVEIKQFPGGLYGVARCKGIPNIGPTWKKLVEWREDSHYQKAHHQWLEEAVSVALFATLDGTNTDDETVWDQVELDLYIPIAE